MKFKRYIIILIAVMSALTGFAHAADNRTFEKFYNLSSEEFKTQLYKYIDLNQTDSAMLCANIQASKYGKKKLTIEEIKACCDAFRYMGNEYLRSYYNYQLAAEYNMKAEQIAEKYGFGALRCQIVIANTVLTATQNALENNFDYNQNVMDDFKDAFNYTLDQIKAKNTEINRFDMETAAINALYFALKYDKTKDVINMIQAYHEARKLYGVASNNAELLCDAIDYYNAGDDNKAFEALKTPLSRSRYNDDKSTILIQSMIKIAQHAVLLKSGKRAEALKLLQEQEQFLREKEMPFELLEVLQLIKQYYEAEGNEAMANKYSLLYYTTKDEFINKSSLGKMDQAKLNIELEETRERIREMSFRQKMQFILLWSAIIIALLALTILGVLYANYRKTKRTNRLLYEKNVALLNDNKQLRPIAESPQNTTKDELSPADLELLEKITEVMESSPEVFNEAFSLNRLAELVSSNTKYVSRAINIGKQCNFSVLLNEYRIKEACRRLMDAENYGNYTIEGIANSVGYKSRSNFATVFKESVGLTPSAFQRLSRDGENALDLGEG